MSVNISYLKNGQICHAELTNYEYERDVWYDEDAGLYMYEDSEGRDYPLHSSGDNPACAEDFDNRREWIYRGLLHRTSGPAFTCDGGNEFHAFGLNFEIEGEFNKFKPFLMRLEKLCLENNIAFSRETMAEGQIHYIDFDFYSVDDDLEPVLESGEIPITSIKTGETNSVHLDDLESELRKNTRTSPLVLALVGMVAGYGINKLTKAHVSKAVHAK